MTEQEEKLYEMNTFYVSKIRELAECALGKNYYTVAMDFYSSTNETVEDIKMKIPLNKLEYLPDKERYRREHPKCKYCKYCHEKRSPILPSAPMVEWTECDLSGNEVRFPNYFKKFCKYYKVKRED